MNNKGFTMVEIIAVIAILGLLVVITTPAYNSISSNIKEKNYNSKKSTIESQTLSYVEKYLKDKVYDGTKKDGSGNIITEKLCIKIEYLIQNGIINSDSEKEEYIENDINGDLYGDIEENENYKEAYVFVNYDNINFKLKAEFKEGKIAEAIDEYKCDDLFIYEGV